MEFSEEFMKSLPLVRERLAELPAEMAGKELGEALARIWEWAKDLGLDLWLYGEYLSEHLDSDVGDMFDDYLLMESIFLNPLIVILSGKLVVNFVGEYTSEGLGWFYDFLAASARYIKHLELDFDPPLNNEAFGPIVAQVRNMPLTHLLLSGSAFHQDFFIELCGREGLVFAFDDIDYSVELFKGVIILLQSEPTLCASVVEVCFEAMKPISPIAYPHELGELTASGRTIKFVKNLGV